MKSGFIIRRLAEAQLTQAYHWYEARAPGLGTEFLRSFEAACAQIGRQPKSSPIVFMDYRRNLLRKFPFGIFYAIEESGVVVAAVFHLARRPGSIHDHLSR